MIGCGGPLFVLVPCRSCLQLRQRGVAGTYVVFDMPAICHRAGSTGHPRAEDLSPRYGEQASSGQSSGSGGPEPTYGRSIWTGRSAGRPPSPLARPADRDGREQRGGQRACSSTRRCKPHGRSPRVTRHVPGRASGHWPVYGDQADTVAWPHGSAAVRMSRRLPRPGLLRGSFIGRYAASSAHSSACGPPCPDTPTMHPSCKLHLLNIQGPPTP